MKLTSTLIIFACGAIAMNSAHAEKYCKSVDQSGNTSYTLAPETGCNKKFKTVSVIQRVTTVVTTPTPETTQVSEAQMQEAAKARAEEMAAKAAVKASEQAKGTASNSTEVAKDGQ